MGSKTSCPAIQLNVKPREGNAGEEQILTVMTYNTFLLEANFIAQVVKKPNMKERADGIAQWFDTLRQEEVPDVLVLNEIMSLDAERMLQALGSSRWDKNAPSSETFRKGALTFIECDASSHFGYMTACVNSTSSISPVKEGGVVVLVRKGLTILDAAQEVFTNGSGADGWANKGFWLVHAQKGTQTYWIVGTHAQAWPGVKEAGIRLSQFRQMRAAVNRHVGDGERVVFAGDMNIFENGQPNEFPGMCAALGDEDGKGVPVTAGDIVPAGFWLPLDIPLENSADVTKNHYLHHDPEEVSLGSQRSDWVLAPGTGSRLKAPAAMRYQLVPIKASTSFASEKKSGTWTDDLSDHFAVFAQLRYDKHDDWPGMEKVLGHRGCTGCLPEASPDSPAPLLT